MFTRNIIKYFQEWSQKAGRKPLVVRGARQIGKTAAIKIFAETQFKNLIYLNLEKEDHKSLFQRVMAINDLIQAIQLKTGQEIIPGSTLLFIDEIQYSAPAMTQLRYFYEEIPQLHVVAAGSLLEIKIKKEGFSFPVGRVEYCYMHPVTFDEFLTAMNDQVTRDYLSQLKLDSAVPEEIHATLMKKYFDYILVGGMPEAVAKYALHKNLLNLESIYESILMGFKDDVYKYASHAKSRYIQHVIEYSPKYVGQTVKYENFGESGFRSREMKEAFDILEKAMLITRAYASSSVSLPVINNLRKSPKLFFLDTGLVNFAQKIREGLLNLKDMNVAFKGQIAEQAVAQSLLSLFIHEEPKLSTWCRDKAGTSSEVDFILPMENRVIPIEVKSGKTGRLRSLHQFMLESPQDLAIKISSNQWSVEDVKTAAPKSTRIISLPFYLLSRMEELVQTMI